MSKMYEMVEIYTVNKCEDKVRSCNNDEDPFDISLNVCNRKFPKLLMTKKWSFNEIYVETFRMQKLYVMEKNSTNFFTILGVMAQENVSKEVDGINGKVYLPFQAHFSIRCIGWM